VIDCARKRPETGSFELSDNCSRLPDVLWFHLHNVGGYRPHIAQLQHCLRLIREAMVVGNTLLTRSDRLIQNINKAGCRDSLKGCRCER